MVHKKTLNASLPSLQPAHKKSFTFIIFFGVLTASQTNHQDQQDHQTSETRHVRGVRVCVSTHDSSRVGSKRGRRTNRTPNLTSISNINPRNVDLFQTTFALSVLSEDAASWTCSPNPKPCFWFQVKQMGVMSHIELRACLHLGCQWQEVSFQIRHQEQEAISCLIFACFCLSVKTLQLTGKKKHAHGAATNFHILRITFAGFR